MSCVSVPSPAILKRSTGAANVGTAGGDTVQQWLTAFDVAMGEVQSDVGALESLTGTLMPKSGGTFSGSVSLAALKFLWGASSEGVQQRLIGITNGDNLIIGSTGNFGVSRLSVVVRQGVDQNFYCGNDAYEENLKLHLSGDGVRFGNAGSRVSTILDQDDFASNSATALATQQSIKSYIDTSVAAIPLPSRELISSADITSGVAAVDLVLGGYDAYIVELVSVFPVSNDGMLRLRTSSDGGVTFDDGASDYRSVIGSEVVSSAGYIPLTLSSGVNNSTVATGYSANIKIANPAADKYTGVVAMGGYYGGSSSIVPEKFDLFGYREESAAVDAIRLYFNNGNIASGKIALYGVNL